MVSGGQVRVCTCMCLYVCVGWGAIFIGMDICELHPQ